MTDLHVAIGGPTVIIGYQLEAMGMWKPRRQAAIIFYQWEVGVTISIRRKPRERGLIASSVPPGHLPRSAVQPGLHLSLHIDSI